MITLKTSPEDENFILPYMKPEVEKGDIVNLAPYSFYMKVSGDEAEDAFSGTTVPLDVEGNEKIADVVIHESRKQYGVKKQDVEKYLKNLLDINEAAKKEKPKNKKVKTKDKPKLRGI